MSREIVLGNGELLVNLDRHLSIRDIYYPYVGWANHVGGYRCRIGAWVKPEGEEALFSWCDQNWDWRIRYQPGTLVTDCEARHARLGLRLHVAHAVAPDQNIFLQRLTVENMRDKPCEVRVFFSHDLRIDESDIGDTALYYPEAQAIIHYKRDRYFLFSGQIGEGVPEDGQSIKQYACGEKAFRGAEGTWRDAEDGGLSMNAIAQGSVDSTVGYTLTLPAHGKAKLRTWMTVGETLDQVITMQDTLHQRGFETILEMTEEKGRAFTENRPGFASLDLLPPRVAELARRSLLIIRTQADKRGAILASNDSDIMETARAHYSYMWPRDGALVSFALDRVGVREITQPFFEFCARVLPKQRAALMHKYGPDGTMGASWHPWIVNGVNETPFQEDGTALVVWAFWQHYQAYADQPFAEEMYHRLIRPAAKFLVSFRDPKTGLIQPSWDVWEERHGAHIFTTAAVCGALSAASSCAVVVGDTVSADEFRTAADEVRDTLSRHFWDEQTGHFARMVTVDAQGEIHKDTTADASAYAVFAFGALPADHPQVVATMQALGRKLWVRAGAGGLARYERDYYFRVSDDFAQVPGNPWIICTLWLADWYIATAQSEADLRSALDLLEWASICSLPTGVLSEQMHPFTMEPLSVAPLTWSHAQFLQTTMAYLEKLAFLKKPS